MAGWIERKGGITRMIARWPMAWVRRSAEHCELMVGWYGEWAKAFRKRISENE
jgi:hypothetical protein